MKREGREVGKMGSESKFREHETEAQKYLLKVAGSAEYPVEIRQKAMGMRNTIDAILGNILETDDGIAALDSVISECQQLLLQEYSQRAVKLEEFSAFLASVQAKIHSENYDFLG